ncbi:hypothetical protein M0805_000849 [Coniferiporia weirii]|nr:hypothetical protein M0805_000849 [Coniferiporia weirii]
MSDVIEAPPSGGGRCEPTSVPVSTYTPAPACLQTKPLSRLHRMITCEESKAMQLQRQPRPVPNVKPGRRRSLGKLALMLQVPDDVIREIAEHLSPLDLLHLARSTRGLRGMLMSKSARPIWRAALDVLGIPKGPPDINEPQLVSLMFEKSCQGCGTPRVQKVDYGLRLRLCRSCFSLNVIRGSELAVEIQNVTSGDTIYRLCVYKDGKERFFRPDFIDVVEKYLSYEPGSAAQVDFAEARKKIVEETIEHGIAVHNWFSHITMKKIIDSMSEKRSRSESIFERLRALGYTDGDLFSNTSSWKEWNGLVYQPRKLTQRIWKGVLPRLEGIIRQRREEIRQRGEDEVAMALRNDRSFYRHADLIDHYRHCCKIWAKAGGECPPINFTELRDLFEVKALLEKGSEISGDEWSEIKALLPGAFRSHSKRIRRDCADFIVSAREKAGLAPIPVDDNSDPIDIILSHPSGFISRYPNKSWSLDTFDELLAVRWGGSFVDYSKQRWPFRHPPSPLVPKYVEALIRSLHWPGTATMQYAENLGAIFICNCCPPSDRRKMKWKELVIHFCDKEESCDMMSLSPGSSSVKMEAVNDHDINAREDLALIVPEVSEEELDERQTF